MKNSLLILLLLTGKVLVAQNNKEWYNDTVKFDSLLVNNALKRQFATIYNPNLGNGLGSYASVSIKDAKVEFSGNHCFKKGDVLGIKVNGGISDGVTNIFSNTKWNSNFGFDLSYNLFWKNRLGKGFMPYKVDVPDDELEANWNKVNEIVYKSKIELLEIKNETEKYKKDLDSLKKAQAKNEEQDLLLAAKIELLQFKIDQFDEKGKGNELRIKRADTLTKLKQSIQAESFKIHWLSFSYGVNSNGFKRFDESLSFSDQIWKESFVTHKLRAQYQWYQKGAFPNKAGNISSICNVISNHYFAIYIEGGEKDNFSSLTDQEIVEKKEYGPSTDIRSSTDKYTAYTGDYKKGIQFMNLGADFYWFLFNESKAGIHFSPKYRIAESLQPEFDFLTGFYASFKNEEKDGPRINVELFLNFTNLMKYNDRDIEPNHFKRATYGLSFTMPIQFNWD